MARRSQAASVVIEGQSAQGPYRNEVAIDARTRQDAAALRSLWARHRIASLCDQEALEGGDASAAHHRARPALQPAHAVHQLHRGRPGGAQPGAADTAAGVDQPPPLPQGVSELAVGQSLGAEVPSTPEPETLGAIAVVLSMLAMLRRRARRHDARRFTA